mmetsp:Transcript_15004/g.20704  ORF Transcript_15004/g.20704 Transcript_15004/m.20704 type:complete len:103 (+) Transcript_15004:368-676(+)
MEEVVGVRLTDVPNLRLGAQSTVRHMVVESVASMKDVQRQHEEGTLSVNCMVEELRSGNIVKKRDASPAQRGAAGSALIMEEEEDVNLKDVPNRLMDMREFV